MGWIYDDIWMELWKVLFVFLALYVFIFLSLFAYFKLSVAEFAYFCTDKPGKPIHSSRLDPATHLGATKLYMLHLKCSSAVARTATEMTREQSGFSEARMYRVLYYSQDFEPTVAAGYITKNPGVLIRGFIALSILAFAYGLHYIWRRILPFAFLRRTYGVRVIKDPRKCLEDPLLTKG